MRYLRSFQLSAKKMKARTIYPYNILANKRSEVLVFDTVTILYGTNGSGKSTLLNILAQKLGIPGAEPPKQGGSVDYFANYVNESQISFELDEVTNRDFNIPANSRYIKSEDILYEIKKIQQEAILREGYFYERGKLGETKEERLVHAETYEMNKNIEKLTFAQEKYSNGETAKHIYEDYIEPDAIYLLDEPEASLSPENQLKLVDFIADAARFLNCQFIIATHSPFLLGGLESTIYQLDLPGLHTCDWTSLENVQTYQRFFAKHSTSFNNAN